MGVYLFGYKHPFAKYPSLDVEYGEVVNGQYSVKMDDSDGMRVL
jgi:hypothetical protein